uniref:Hexosyltransferase n=1 Tax=Latimeria chalumnae TaxID=7897 RepID=H3B1U7_LATCH
IIFFNANVYTFAFQITHFKACLLLLTLVTFIGFIYIHMLWYRRRAEDWLCTSCIYSQQINPGEYEFLSKPNINCSADPPFLVILVTTTHNQYEVRKVIRASWGKERTIGGKRIVTFFLLGITDNFQYQAQVMNESKWFKDLIQQNFIDTYFNLTLKMLMGLEWVYHFCPQSSFVMKTDTDIFVNVLYLTELLLTKNRTSNFVTGFLKLNEAPIRYRSSKWYVSKIEYPWSTYPPFCSGTGYVFSSDIAGKVFNISSKIPFLKLEDVYFGLCLSKLQITPERLTANVVFFPEKTHFSACSLRQIVTLHQVTPYEMLLYWDWLENPSITCTE